MTAIRMTDTTIHVPDPAIRMTDTTIKVTDTAIYVTDTNSSNCEIGLVCTLISNNTVSKNITPMHVINK